MTDIANRISEFIVDNLLLGKKVDIPSMRSFLEEGVIDSTGVLELVQFLEESWGFTVQDEEMIPENLDSLDGLTRFVRRKLGRPDHAGVAAGSLKNELAEQLT